MKAARCRRAGEGEFENEWNRLSGFKRARVSTDGPIDVEAALRVNDGDEGEEVLGVGDGLSVVLPCSGVVSFSARLLCSMPLLRVHDGETAYRREARMCRRVEDLEAPAAWRST